MNYITVQGIKEEKRDNEGFTILLDLVVPPLEFLVVALGGLLIHLVCLGLFALGLRKWRQRPTGKHLQIKILGFFFFLFWFFIDQFYNGKFDCIQCNAFREILVEEVLILSSAIYFIGNLSTENITVDVSDLLLSEEQILRTKREPCFLDKVRSLLTWVAKVMRHNSVMITN